MNIRVLNLDNLQETTEVLTDIDFDKIEGESCVPYVLKWQLAKRRLGSAKTKLMSEVSGSTRKIVKQKHTGSARHGSRRAVQFVGGRTCFGPQPRDFGFSIPKKIVKKALSYVLKNKIKEDKLILVEGIDNFEISTNKLSKKLASKNINNALFAYNTEYVNFMKSLRNLYNYKAILSKALNVYDVLNYDFLLLDKKAFEEFKEVL